MHYSSRLCNQKAHCPTIETVLQLSKSVILNCNDNHQPRARLPNPGIVIVCKYSGYGFKRCKRTQKQGITHTDWSYQYISYTASTIEQYIGVII